MKLEMFRRELSELITQHEIVRDIRSVVTEGPRDRGFYDWYFAESGIEVAVYPVEAIEVGADIVAKYGYPNNNRGRVLTLAAVAAERISPQQLVCVVDADLDHANTEALPALAVKSDYTSLELYGFDAATVQKLARVGYAGLEIGGATVVEAITPLLRRLFLARIANARLGWSLSKVDWIPSAQASGGVVTFDEDDYHRRYLMRNARMAMLDTFRAEVEAAAARLERVDARRAVHGHDLTDVLAWFFRQQVGGRAMTSAELQRMLLLSLERPSLAKEPLFRELYDRLSRR